MNHMNDSCMGPAELSANFENLIILINKNENDARNGWSGIADSINKRVFTISVQEEPVGLQ